jgi:uncharacterized membrane protein
VTVAVIDRTYKRFLRPLYAVLLGGIVSLFLGALLGDIAYTWTYEVQWKNFASWLIVAGLVFGGFALVCALIGLFRGAQHGRQPTIYFFLLLATWVLGFFNALIHAKDAWASMPEGLILSVLTAALAIAATWLTYSTDNAERK